MSLNGGKRVDIRGRKRDKPPKKVKKKPVQGITNRREKVLKLNDVHAEGTNTKLSDMGRERCDFALERFLKSRGISDPDVDLLLSAVMRPNKKHQDDLQMGAALALTEKVANDEHVKHLIDNYDAHILRFGTGGEDGFRDGGEMLAWTFKLLKKAGDNPDISVAEAAVVASEMRKLYNDIRLNNQKQKRKGDRPKELPATDLDKLRAELKEQGRIG